MSQLQWEVRVAPSPEPASDAITEATRSLQAGNREAAVHQYEVLQRQRMLHPVSWSNLAALAVGLGDAAGARGHAQRALQLDPRNADAWVNFSVASWHLGHRRDAAQAMHRAVELSPGMEAAALAYATMLQVVNRRAQARAVLAEAARVNPRSWRLQQALAEITRLSEESESTRAHALAALARLLPSFRPTVEAGQSATANEAEAAAASMRVRDLLFSAADRLDAVGLPFHLIGGTLLAIHRDGRLFPHDKDIDLALPANCDRDVVAAAFAQGFTAVLPAGHAEPEARTWVMGFVEVSSGLGVDLLFAHARGGKIRFELGWPDRLATEVPAYALQALQWEGREWQVPSPPERYLASIYGADWNDSVTSRGFNRRWFDTQVSNPSRTVDSLPRAINLALLRLLQALQAGQWERAHALCVQLLAREELPEVRQVLLKLPGAVYNGSGFDG